LARLESQAAAADPALEARMVAGHPRRWLAWRPGLRLALVLLVAGTTLVLATIQLSVWVAFVGVLMIGVALRWTVTVAPARAARVAQWWRSGVRGG
jgi:hypothetical protein